MHQHIENIVYVLNQVPLDTEQKLARLKEFVEFSARTTFTGPVMYICEDEEFSYTIDYNYEDTSTRFEISKEDFEKWAEKSVTRRTLYNTNNIRLLGAIDRLLMLAKMYNVEDLLKGEWEVGEDRRFDEFIEKIAPHHFILPEIITLITMIGNIENYNTLAKTMLLSRIGQKNSTEDIYNQQPMEFPMLRINWEKAIVEAKTSDNWKAASSLSAGTQAFISMFLTVGNFDSEVAEEVSEMLTKG